MFIALEHQKKCSSHSVPNITTQIRVAAEMTEIDATVKMKQVSHT